MPLAVIRIGLDLGSQPRDNEDLSVSPDLPPVEKAREELRPSAPMRWDSYESPMTVTCPCTTSAAAARQTNVGAFTPPFANQRQQHGIRIFREMQLAPD